jgi:DNA phosphorothioation-dependent restriction protein DptG
MYQRDLSFDRQWQSLLKEIDSKLGMKPKDLNGVLFIIGVQELGKGFKHFSKEEKQDLMHIAICRVLSQSGYYELEGTDKDGWPHWKMIKKLPHFDLLEQEKLLKIHVIEYFESEYGWHLESPSQPDDIIT